MCALCAKVSLLLEALMSSRLWLAATFNVHFFSLKDLILFSLHSKGPPLKSCKMSRHNFLRSSSLNIQNLLISIVFCACFPLQLFVSGPSVSQVKGQKSTCWSIHEVYRRKGCGYCLVDNVTSYMTIFWKVLPKLSNRILESSQTYPLVTPPGSSGHTDSPG